MFPPSFDPKIYKLHEDLKDFSLEELMEHYKVFGKNEGRFSSEIREKKDILNLLDEDVTLNLGEEDNKDIYKFVVCDHHRENIDFITHLEKIYEKLEEEGYFILIIEDKRYTSNHFITETTVTDVLSDYYESPQENSLKRVVEHRCYTTHNDTKQHWNKEHGERRIDENKYFLKYALNEYNEKHQEPLKTPKYQFTPDSFKEIFEKLVFLGLTRFSIEEIYPTLRDTNEFFVVLKK